jgi:hypothetical protein
MNHIQHIIYRPAKVPDGDDIPVEDARDGIMVENGMCLRHNGCIFVRPVPNGTWPNNELISTAVSDPVSSFAA